MDAVRFLEESWMICQTYDSCDYCRRKFWMQEVRIWSAHIGWKKYAFLMMEKLVSTKNLQSVTENCALTSMNIIWVTVEKLRMRLGAMQIRRENNICIVVKQIVVWEIINKQMYIIVIIYIVIQGNVKHTTMKKHISKIKMRKLLKIQQNNKGI